MSLLLFISPFHSFLCYFASRVRQLAAILLPIWSATFLVQENEQLARVKAQAAKGLESIGEFNGKTLQNYGDGSLNKILTAHSTASVAPFKFNNCCSRNPRVVAHGDTCRRYCWYEEWSNLWRWRQSRTDRIATSSGGILFQRKLKWWDKINPVLYPQLGCFELKNIKQPLACCAPMPAL